ncbi:MAG TPA: hypothetical protein VJ875_09610 [Pyrinomonadaceae bacterium]|nr:hypothetical protein [Pyrinomonadaceae bacterium]
MSNDYSMGAAHILRLQNAVSRSSGYTSKYIETITVTEGFHGFQEEVPWRRDVAVFEISGHPKAKRAYAWFRNESGTTTPSYVVVLGVPPINSARAAVAAAMAASIVKGMTKAPFSALVSLGRQM